MPTKYLSNTPSECNLVDLLFIHQLLITFVNNHSVYNGKRAAFLILLPFLGTKMEVQINLVESIGTLGMLFFKCNFINLRVPFFHKTIDH